MCTMSNSSTGKFRSLRERNTRNTINFKINYNTMALDTNTQQDLDSEISASLRSLYWANLGFALEWRVKAWNISENTKQIQDDVASLLISQNKWGNMNNQQIQERLEEILSPESLTEISKQYESYRQEVLKRWDLPAVEL